MRRPEHLRRCQRVVGCRARLPVRGRALRERRLPEHDEAVGLLEIVVGPEAEGVDLPFRGRVHPPALVARERSLLVVGRDDVLPQLRSDRLQQKAHAPDQREVARDRMLALEHVSRGRTCDRRSGERAEDHTTIRCSHRSCVLPRALSLEPALRRRVSWEALWVGPRRPPHQEAPHGRRDPRPRRHRRARGGKARSPQRRTLSRPPPAIARTPTTPPRTRCSTGCRPYPGALGLIRRR